VSPIRFHHYGGAAAAQTPPALFVYTPELEQGGYPEACPFNTHRAGRTRAILHRMGLLSGHARRETPPVALEEDELLGFHAAEYLAALKAGQEGRFSPGAVEMGLGTPDCPIFDGMYDYVRLAAGGTVAGARALLRGDASVVFNPSGGFHHAHAARASGFCYINDVVLGALELAGAGKRIAILDIDVHHGDGQQAAFYDRNDVLTISMHESGRTLFPGTGFETEIGAGPGHGYNVNVPLPVGAYDAAYETAFLGAALPLLEAYAPDVVMLELGMDTLAGDPLAHLNLTNNVLADVLERVRKLGKPILAVGGGGYNIANTVRGWALCWSVLVGDHSHQHDLGVGMGGVMLENTDWLGGLRDRALLSDGGRRGDIDAEVNRVIEALRATVFPIHGLA
jgi:acetoin utilization protein AcuC